MKKLILCAALAAFAISVQAGDNKAAKAKDACCEATKAANAKACETTAKAAGCETAKAACCDSVKGTACKATVAKKALLSPKHAAEVRS